MVTKPASATGDARAHADRVRTRPAVGREVRRWRQQRGLTLAQVAEASGLNIGYLSQIENDKASPSLESLAAVGGAMDVPITWFLLESAPPPRVVRAGERRRRKGPGDVTVEEVDGGIPRDVRIVIAISQPGQSSGVHAHAGDEHHFMLSGRLRARQGRHVFELGPGDYLLWDATIPHDAECIGDEPASVLIISHRAHGAETLRTER
ncbi:MAG: cupin domain-containing protein [Chloroflexota bacterium]|nr:cupin domain-containing protein [Chloroflexota bacterium]